MNKRTFKEFLLYLIVGVIATVSEWVIFFLLNKVALHYIIATAVAYILSTLVNWMAGRLLVFKKGKQSVLKEIGEIYIASIIGLLLNLLIMWVAVDLLCANEMMAKVLATALVFIYNFLVRKKWIYKK